MSGTLIIVFREVLEAALVVSIVLAATKGVPRRGTWVLSGILVGLVGAGVVALLADRIAAALSGMGQEVFNAAVLFLAVIMLAWHTVWMARHGRAIAQRMREVGASVVEGERPLYALAIVVGLAVLREGSEIVLFLYGIAAASSQGTAGMLVGGLMGLAAGLAVGAALYFGLLRIPLRHLFFVTGWMIVLLASGMAAQGAGYLVQADVLPPLGQSVWNSSAILPEQSILGQLLHTLIGYDDRPVGIQVVVYVITLLVIGGLMVLFGKAGAPASKKSVAVLALAALLAGLGATQAQATDLKAYSPHVEEGEVALEARGNWTVDDDDGLDDVMDQRYELEWGVTDIWHTALIGKLKQEANGPLRYDATAWENIIQVTEPGEHWLDFGLYFEFSAADDPDAADKIEFKPLFEKSVGRFTVLVNPIFEKEVGNNAEDSVEFEYAWQTRYRLLPEFEPGFEAYGGIGEISDTRALDEQRHQIGPVFFGKLGAGDYGAVKYELGWLFGLTDGSADGSLKWLVEYELPFSL